MKLRLFAAALAAAALAACDGSPAAVRPELVGTWLSEPRVATFPIPSGATPGSFVDSWTFDQTGAYTRAMYSIQSTGKSWTLYVEKGSWRATGDVLAMVVRAYAHNQQPLSEQPPEPQPVTPQVVKYQYSLTETNTLTFYPDCPEDAICEGLPIVLHRGAFLD
ncbi:MAG TPA: hypothetical protein VF771_14775 [Longimicrobiaceae bacterium]